MDETRHVASWIGGQEALHDRVLTLDEALEAVDGGRCRRRPARRRRAHPRRRPAAGGRRPGPLPARRSTRACGCRHDRAADDGRRPRAGGRGRRRAVDAARDLAPGRRSTSGSGSLSLARAELETLAGDRRARRPGARRPRRGALADRRPGRCRRGGREAPGRRPRGRRSPWSSPPRRPRGLGRPSEARRIADRALDPGRRPDRSGLRRHAALRRLARRPGAARAIAGHALPARPGRASRRRRRAGRGRGGRRRRRPAAIPDRRPRRRPACGTRPSPTSRRCGRPGSSPPRPTRRTCSAPASARSRPATCDRGRGPRPRRAALARRSRRPSSTSIGEPADPGLELVRGDAFRLVGHEIGAMQSYGAAMAAAARRRPAREPLSRPPAGDRPDRRPTRYDIGRPSIDPHPRRTMS